MAAKERVGRASENKKIRINLRMVAYQKGALWFAHCLEMDIVADGKDPISAINNLVELAQCQIIEAHIDDDLGRLFRPAPPEVFRWFSEAEDLSDTEDLNVALPSRPSRSSASSRRFGSRKQDISGSFTSRQLISA
jgi:hypothetical protein